VTLRHVRPAPITVKTPIGLGRVADYDDAFMKNVVTASRGRVLMVAHNAEPPTDEEWKDFLRALDRHGIEGARLLVWTDGAAPNSAQRQALNDQLGGRTIPIAVLSTSTFVRGVATAISWFNPGVKVFPPDKVNDAIRHLGIEGPLAVKMAEAFAQLRAELRPLERSAR
jgi:hypothetical protein